MIRDHVIESHQLVPAAGRVPDRRLHRRCRLPDLSYIELGAGNGGIVLDISEGGLAFQAVTALATDGSPLPIRFQLPRSADWVEAGGRPVWASESGTEAALQFINLPPQARNRLRDWISAQNPDHEPPRAAPPHAKKTIAPARAPFASASAANADFDSPAAGLAALMGDLFQHRFTAPILLGIVVLLSFALGASVADIWRLRHTPAEKPAQTQAAAPQSAPPAAAGAAGATQSPATAGPSSPSVPASRAKSSPPATPSPAPPRLPVSSAASVASPSTGANPESIIAGAIEAPEKAISASSSIAITSRRSVPLPASAYSSKGQPPSVNIVTVLDHVDPFYPPEAIAKRIEGTILLRASISRDGVVTAVEPLSGPAELYPSAIAAVRSWRYKPTYVNGHAVATTDQLRITYRLPH
jgi:periplasmic protein TonB